MVHAQPPRDPSGETCPDFLNEDTYQVVLDALERAEVRDENNNVTHEAKTREQAAELLSQQWTMRHAQQKTAWEAFLAEEQQEREAEELMRRDLDTADEVQRLAEEAKHREDERKKFTPIPMPKPGRGPSVNSRPLVHPYAATKCKARLDHPLWYYSSDARDEAQRKGAGGGYGDTDIALLPNVYLKSTAATPSNNAVADELLNWDTFETCLLEWTGAMEQFQYPSWAVSAWRDLFAQFSATAYYRTRSSMGILAVIHYISEIKSEWYSTIALTLDPFDVSIIEERRFDRIEQNYLRERQLAATRAIESVAANAMRASSSQPHTTPPSLGKRACDSGNQGQSTPAQRSRYKTREKPLQVFRTDAHGPTLRACCVICLSTARESHNWTECQSTSLWNGKPAFVEHIPGTGQSRTML
jgi:hypothetical protein